MNIFFLSTDPHVAAYLLCDKHVVKMLLELCQLLWGAYYSTATHGWQSTVPNNIKIYRRTHLKHPMAIWCSRDPDNFKWAAAHAIAIAEEYRRRYHKTHACDPIVRWLSANPPPCDSLDSYSVKTVLAQCDYPNNCTPPPLAITNRKLFVMRENAISLVYSYLNYYEKDKSLKPWFSFTRRDK